ncbi:hypothetical protein [Burkholderia phage BCSR5]|nr:hypothetical protein [Burkholderia phage BCSR5]
MGQFKTAKEEQKWRQLEAASESSLEKIMKGEGKPADFDRLGATLKKYDLLAARIFEQGLESMNEAADILLAKIAADRAKKGKEPLTEEQTAKLFEQALDRQFKEFGPDLVETVDSILDRKLEAQDERTEKSMTSHFDKFREFMKPAVERRKEHEDADAHVQKAKEVQQQEKEKQEAEDRDNAIWDKRLDQIEERVITAFRKTIIDVARELRGGGTAPGTGGIVNTSMGLLKKMISGTAEAGKNVIGKAKEVGQTAVTALMSPKNQDAIVDNSKKQASFTELLSGSLKSMLDWVRKRGSTEDERDDKRENRWLRKLKLGGHWLKGKAGKVKDALTSGGLWTNLLKGAMMAIMAPGLITTIAKKLGETLSWENIKNTFVDWWGKAKDIGGDALGWVWDKLQKIDYKGIANSLWETITNLATKAKDKAKEIAVGAGKTVWEWGKSLFTPKTGAEQTGYGPMAQKAANNAAADEMLRAAGKYNSGSESSPSFMGPPSTAAVGGAATKGLVGDQNAATTPYKPAGSTGTAAALASGTDILDNTQPVSTAPMGSNRSTVTNAFNFNAPGRSTTSSVSQNSVVFRSGATVPQVPGEQAAQAAATTAPKASGSAKAIGMGSYGLTSGVGDGLMVINLGIGA